MKTVQEHEILVHGVEHEQYFQGCGLAFTRFTDVATGIGNDASEAYDDALESLAQNDWEVEPLENLITQIESGNHVVVCPMLEEQDEHDDECPCHDLHVYVSVRVR